MELHSFNSAPEFNDRHIGGEIFIHLSVHLFLLFSMKGQQFEVTLLSFLTPIHSVCEFSYLAAKNIVVTEILLRTVSPKP